MHNVGRGRRMSPKHRIGAVGFATGLGAGYAFKYGIVFATLGVLMLWMVVGSEIPGSEASHSLRHFPFYLVFRVASVIGAFVGGFVATATSHRKGILTGVSVGAAIVALRIAYFMLVSSTRDVATSELAITAAVIPIAWLGATLAERRRSQDCRSIKQNDGWKQPPGDGQLNS